MTVFPEHSFDTCPEPLDQRVNEAVSDFVARRSKEVKADLEATLEKLRAYRKSDPDFERTIADYIDAEASLKEDPAEGLAQHSPDTCPPAPAGQDRKSGFRVRLIQYRFLVWLPVTRAGAVQQA